MEKKYYAIIEPLLRNDIPNNDYPEDDVRKLKFFTIYYRGNVYGPNKETFDSFNDSIWDVESNVRAILNNSTSTDEEILTLLKGVFNWYYEKDSGSFSLNDIMNLLDMVEDVRHCLTVDTFCKYLKVIFSESFSCYTYHSKENSSLISYACPRKLSVNDALAICSCYTQDGRWATLTEDAIDIEDPSFTHKYSYDLEDNYYVTRDFIPNLGTEWNDNKAKAYLSEKYNIPEELIEVVNQGKWEEIIDNIIYLDDPKYLNAEHQKQTLDSIDNEDA